VPDDYRNHHYVPQWYQKKFMLPGEHELFHLDMKPDTFADPRGITHTKKALKRQGSKMCFVEEDLYTTRVQGIETKDIEKHFFGAIDTKGRPAVEYFENFSYPLKDWKDYLQDIMRYMSTQKLRTPKGLSFVSEKIGTTDKDAILRTMLRLRNIHAAIWMECVWLVADASQSPDADNIDAIVISHEHADHCDIGQIRTLLEKNPSAQVITHEAVGTLLKEADIPHTLIEDGETITIKGVEIQSHGSKHATFYGDVPPCRNTGYLIGRELFMPGDALHDIPTTPPRILALPCGGPWMRLSEAIDYAKKLKPKVVFPIHDAIYIEEFRGDLIPRIVGGNLEAAGIQFIDMAPMSSHDYED